MAVPAPVTPPPAPPAPPVAPPVPVNPQTLLEELAAHVRSVAASAEQDITELLAFLASMACDGQDPPGLLQRLRRIAGNLMYLLAFRLGWQPEKERDKGKDGGT